VRVMWGESSQQGSPLGSARGITLGMAQMGDDLVSLSQGECCSGMEIVLYIDSHEGVTLLVFPQDR